MKHLILGGEGFIGAALTARLLAEGHEAVVLGTGKTSRLDGLAKVALDRLDDLRHHLPVVDGDVG